MNWSGLRWMETASRKIPIRVSAAMDPSRYRRRRGPPARRRPADDSNVASLSGSIAIASEQEESRRDHVLRPGGLHVDFASALRHCRRATLCQGRRETVGTEMKDCGW